MSLLQMIRFGYAKKLGLSTDPQLEVYRKGCLTSALIVFMKREHIVDPAVRL